MFERTLQDLIRGLRAHRASSKAAEDAFLAEAMTELKEELKGKDMALKAEGVLKMCYLMMLYPIPPPAGFAFHVVEVMSSPRYHLKQIGYLACPMAFSGETEEVVLTVNGIKKDLLSPQVSLPPIPLTALPHLLALSSSLSNTLHADLLHLLTHSSPRIRKRAVLCLLPCWEAFPEGLREGFPRLRDRLQDDDPSVVGAAVGVIMELARRQGGQNYLTLAPELFGILTSSSNNWILIKVVKLFAILTPLEPRLVRKLLPPITNLISSTSAISLLYECVRTCIVGGMLDPDRAEGEALARVCVEKLGGYLRDEGGDQNLRYIALLAMVKIIPTHPHMVSEYQDEILESLDDSDISIRMRALELVSAMVDEDNLQTIVDQLLAHLAPPSTTSALPSAIASLQAASDPSVPTTQDSATTSLALNETPAYRLTLSLRLLSIISHDTYAHVTDFEWVISVLIDVAYVSNVDIGKEINAMLLDIVGRVKSVRQYAVKTLEKVVADETLRERGDQSSAELSLLEAAVWICGEYASNLSSPLSTISSVLSPTLVHSASSSLVSLSLHAVGKIFATYAADISSSWTTETHSEAKNLVSSIKAGLQPFSSSPDIEIQERAVEISTLLSFVEADLKSHNTLPTVVKNGDDIPGLEGGFEGSNDTSNPPYPKSLFLFQPLFTSHELNAVAISAQSSIRVPEGLDLEAEIVPQSGLGDVHDEELESEEEKGIDLGEGGGAGLEELRRVLREQEKGATKKKGKGRSKGKERKIEGEVMSVEEKADKERRKAARKARAKDDPYYLYDDKEGDDDAELDVDDIPIVKLDDLDISADEPVPSTDSKSRTRDKSKVKAKSKASKQAVQPPEIDRSGEMPVGADPLPAGKAEIPPKQEKGKTKTSGLASVDLSQPPTRPTSRFDEYKDGDADADGTNGSRGGEDGRETPDVPVSEEIEVVRVKRKKKKEGKKKVGVE